jgi:hypothetical protein
MKERAMAHNPATAPMSLTARARGAGALLIAATLLEILAMAHHPAVHTHDLSQAIGQLRMLAGVAALVHGILITLMWLGFFALSEFTVRRNPARMAIRFGFMAYAMGLAAMTGAAIVSGFITPGVALASAGVDGTDLKITGQLLNLCLLGNQALARLGVVAMSAGIAAWSLDLVRAPGLERVLGVLGIAIGVGCAGALIGGALQLDVHGMLGVIVAQGIWCIGVGVLLWRAAPVPLYQPIP